MGLRDLDLDDEEKADLKIFEKEKILNPSRWNENNFNNYFEDISVMTYRTYFKDKGRIKTPQEKPRLSSSDENYERILDEKIKKALNDPELDREEKQDLIAFETRRVFNPILWNSDNFYKYFSDIDVATYRTYFKDKKRIIEFKTTNENTNYNYILKGKIEDALHDPELDEEEKVDLRRFRKKGIFNLSS
ncbi:11662_t:CDS:2 [Scutellospora calospora]|uniref:11662_t:CDS:1 n=1 Tax=Scutellospora calospora TaxID=85575 RepID=A0ACA9KL43_9GLOM|nr:11662_t:CDS:2 [Scutellospora calospora]